MRMTVLGCFVLVPVLAGLGQEEAKPAEDVAAPKSYVWVKGDAARQDMFLQDVAAFLEKAGHFYLATCDRQGARVRPIKYTFVVDNALLFVTAKKKEMYTQLVANPNVELSRTAADGSAYLRYKGKAVLSEDEAVKAKVLEAFPFFGKNFGDGLAIFLVEPEMVGIFPMKGGQAKTKIFTRQAQPE